MKCLIWQETNTKHIELKKKKKVKQRLKKQHTFEWHYVPPADVIDAVDKVTNNYKLQKKKTIYTYTNIYIMKHEIVKHLRRSHTHIHILYMYIYVYMHTHRCMHCVDTFVCVYVCVLFVFARVGTFYCKRPPHSSIILIMHVRTSRRE